MGKSVNAGPLSSETETAAHFTLGDLQIGLLSNSPLINQYAHQFLEDWTAARENPAPANDDIQIQLELVDILPDLPDDPPIYQGNGRHLRDGIGTLSVYPQTNGYLLYFFKGGLVQITADDSHIQGYVTVDLLRYGRLYDLIFTSLSSFMRRRGYYLIHAAAAVHGTTASIFVGPPGCGKSTTVLNLALNGWQILSNDTLLLQERAGDIYALPTPGGFSIRPQSVHHIPALTTYIPQPLPEDFYHLSLSKLGLNWAEPALITTIYFPEINNGRKNHLQPIPAAIALAHLIELSLDRWDKIALLAHFDFLEKLSRQANAASLSIANQGQLPGLLTHNA